MFSIHVHRSARDYFVDGIYWGDDEEGVIIYLRAKGVPLDEGLGTDRPGRDIDDPARLNGHLYLRLSRFMV
jgi:hypothetical protein